MHSEFISVCHVLLMYLSVLCAVYRSNFPQLVDQSMCISKNT